MAIALVAVAAGIASSGCRPRRHRDDALLLHLRRFTLDRNREHRPKRLPLGPEERESRVSEPVVHPVAARADEHLARPHPIRGKVHAREPGDPLGEYVKIEGVSFRCRENVGALVDRLWSEESVAPR